MKEEGLFVKRIKKRKYNSYQGEISAAVENIINSNFAHKFYLCTLKIQYLASIQLSMFSKLCRLQLRF